MARKDAWPEERVKQLKQLVEDGWTSTQIGKKMDCTRNAVIGKCHRLQLQLRNGNPVVKQRDAKFISRKPPPKLKVIKRVIVVTPVATKIKVKSHHVPATAKTLTELPRNGCRFPVSRDEHDEWLFCGEVKAVGSYCDHHQMLCVPVPAKQVAGKGRPK